MKTINKFKISLDSKGGQTIDIDGLCIQLTEPLLKADIKDIIGVFKKGNYKLNYAVKFRSIDFLKMFNENSSHSRIYMGALGMLKDENDRNIFSVSMSGKKSLLSWNGFDMNDAVPIEFDGEDINDTTDENAAGADAGDAGDTTDESAAGAANATTDESAANATTDENAAGADDAGAAGTTTDENAAGAGAGAGAGADADAAGTTTDENAAGADAGAGADAAGTTTDENAAGADAGATTDENAAGAADTTKSVKNVKSTKNKK